MNGEKIMKKDIPQTIDEYIKRCPTEYQSRLQTLREVILKAAPEAKEKISWGMATFDYYGNLVHFSCEKNHLGFHPAPSAIIQFQDNLKDFQYSKGTIRFPYDKEFPYQLISQIVEFRVQEQKKHYELKKQGKKIEQEKDIFIIPQEIQNILIQQNIVEQFKKRPPYQQQGYIKGIVEAKRLTTKEKRIHQMIDELKVTHLYQGRQYYKKKS